MEGIRGKSKGKGLEREGEEKFSNQEILEKDFKRKNETEERKERKESKEKKRRQIKVSNGSCHWVGLKLMRKKRVRKVKKRRDKYILQLLITIGKPQKNEEKKSMKMHQFNFKFKQ